MILYPDDMPPIAEEVAAFISHPSELEDNKHLAYEQIGESMAEFVVPPTLCRSDSEIVQGDPVFAAAAPELLTLAAQVSVGSRSLVLENGPEVMNSSDEDSPNEEHGYKLTGMYTNNLKAPVYLSQSQVAQQKAQVAALKTAGHWVDSNAPDTTSATSEWAQSAPSSPANTRCASRFDEPDTLKTQAIPHAKTPTGEAPSKPTVSTAVTMPLPQKGYMRQTFLSDSSGVSEDEPPPAQLLSSRIVPPSEVTPPHAR
jgi:hypothetical protein